MVMVVVLIRGCMVMACARVVSSSVVSVVVKRLLLEVGRRHVDPVGGQWLVRCVVLHGLCLLRVVLRRLRHHPHAWAHPHLLHARHLHGGLGAECALLVRQAHAHRRRSHEQHPPGRPLPHPVAMRWASVEARHAPARHAAAEDDEADEAADDDACDGAAWQCVGADAVRIGRQSAVRVVVEVAGGALLVCGAVRCTAGVGHAEASTVIRGGDGGQGSEEKGEQDSGQEGHEGERGVSEHAARSRRGQRAGCGVCEHDAGVCAIGRMLGVCRALHADGVCATRRRRGEGERRGEAEATRATKLCPPPSGQCPLRLTRTGADG